jgi:hypothetical protein
MKRTKQIILALALLFALAATSSGCTYGKVCQATKVGNHR